VLKKYKWLTITYCIMSLNKSYSTVDSKDVSLDLKLDSIINKNNGFFIELGANDGLTQSNTARLEFLKNWTGILIEPSFEKYIQCIKNRPNSITLNFACVDNEYNNEFILGDFDGHLMSSVDGKRLNNNNLVKVKATTLEIILDKYKDSGVEIDLLSLDTEGYELNILKGLNLKKYRPRFLLIEIYNFDYDNILKYLNDNQYKLHSNFSNYNKTDNPAWDGTHNDFLFVRSDIQLH